MTGALLAVAPPVFATTIAPVPPVTTEPGGFDTVLNGQTPPPAADTAGPVPVPPAPNVATMVSLPAEFIALHDRSTAALALPARLDGEADDAPENVAEPVPVPVPFTPALAILPMPAPPPPPVVPPAAIARPATPPVGLTAAERRSDDADCTPIVQAAAPSSIPFELPAIAATDPVSGARDVAVIRYLDVAKDGIWLDALARDIAASATQDGQLKFALVPATLGRLDVDLRQQADGLHMRLTAQNETARDMLTIAQPRIVDDLRSHGVRVAGTEIAGGTSDSGTHRDRAHPRQPAAFEFSRRAAPAPRRTAIADGHYA